MWHFPACKLQYLQYSYHLRRKLVQLTPVDLSLFNWSSISTLILSGESTITMDLFLEQFSLQRWSRWSQRVGTNLSKKVIYRACWLQSLLLPFSFWFKFQVLLSSRPKNVPKSTLESENLTRNDHSYEQHGGQRMMGRPVFRASNRTLPDLPSAWPWEIWVRDYLWAAQILTVQQKCMKPISQLYSPKEHIWFIDEPSEVDHSYIPALVDSCSTKNN